MVALVNYYPGSIFFLSYNSLILCLVYLLLPKVALVPNSIGPISPSPIIFQSYMLLVLFLTVMFFLSYFSKIPCSIYPISPSSKLS